ncbi:MAG: type II toxin-antitoxin system death-on-curing family toxin [bacterium]|nr:type II toxin-antitoxin system death-on-curing family toxin [bacterium]
MSEPRWLEQAEALVIHQQMVNKMAVHMACESHTLLESALAGPRNHFAYGESDDLFVLAANYVKAICLNHPFIDGNKRTGFTVGLVFLGNQWCFSLG